MDADEEAVRAELRRALVTRAEFELGAEAWQEWEDKVSPFSAAQRKQRAAQRKQRDDSTSDDDQSADDDHSADDVAPAVDPKLLAVTAAPPSAAPTDKIVVVGSAAGLARIKDEAVQLAVWRRRSVPKFVSTLSDPTIAPSGLPHFEGLVAASGAADAVRAELRAQRKLTLGAGELEELARDVGTLVRTFAQLTQSQDVFVKLERLDDNECEFWHQDSDSYLLLTTYRGPCTEWVRSDFCPPRRCCCGQLSQSLEL